jgi:hypothetical protein
VAEHVVSPALFESVYEYAALLESGKAFSEKNVVPETSPIISFTENAFAQFFENEVGSEITGFDEVQETCHPRALPKEKGSF